MCADEGRTRSIYLVHQVLPLSGKGILMSYVPSKDESGKRRYGKWAGCPAGHAEYAECCAMEISSFHGWYGQQCSRKRGHGPNDEFCRQHAAKAAAIAEADKRLLSSANS